jgi:UDP-N-acetylmuramate dehydrogenase
LDYRPELWTGKHVPIPGNGTTPVQISGHGTEIKDISCEVLTTINQELKTFTKEECLLDSLKNEVKDQYIITSVVFKLTKQNHNINTNGISRTN